MEKKEHHRANLYKSKGDSNQKKRREDLLKKQSERRRDLTQHARVIALQEPPDVIIPDTIETTVQDTEINDVVSNVMRKRQEEMDKWKDQLMVPEELSDIPADLAGGWYLVPCPGGLRCLVIAALGKTKCRLNDGSYFKSFLSALPNGARRPRRDEFCILDCIYHEPTKTFYVLDLMCWKGYALYDCATDFRFYWKITKLEEVNVRETSKTNPFSFISLPYFEATKEGLAQCIATPFPFQTETLLFYNKQTDYTLGTTPLVCYFDVRTEANAAWITKIVNGEEEVGGEVSASMQDEKV